MKETYEENIKRLKEIVEKIEDGNTSLEESIQVYEQGAALVKRCENLLNNAE